jgi:hypothetical protein
MHKTFTFFVSGNRRNRQTVIFVFNCTYKNTTYMTGFKIKGNFRLDLCQSNRMQASHKR